jgi:hypothetical protein
VCLPQGSIPPTDSGEHDGRSHDDAAADRVSKDRIDLDEDSGLAAVYTPSSDRGLLSDNYISPSTTTRSRQI